MSTNAYFFGESHADAVSQALLRRTQPQRFVAINITHIDGQQGGTNVFRSPVLQAVLSLSEATERTYFSMLGGNAHNILGLLKHSEPFDFSLSGEPDLPFEQSSEPVTYAYLRAALRELMLPTLALLDAAIQALPGRWFHMASPPTPADNDYVAANLDFRFASLLQSGGSVVSPTVRYKLWRAHSEIMIQECKLRGVGFASAPRKSLIDGQFLRPELCGNATHGNVLYGELVLQQAEVILANEDLIQRRWSLTPKIPTPKAIY